MDFPAQFATVEKRASDALSSVKAAATESREQLQSRIDQAQVDMDLAKKDAQQEDRSGRGQGAEQVGADEGRCQRQDGRREGQDRTAQPAAGRDDGGRRRSVGRGRRRRRHRLRQLGVDNARLAVLDALDARAYAGERAKATSGS